MHHAERADRMCRMTRVLGTPIVWHFVPDEWKPRLRAYLVATRGEDRDLLSAGDFDCQ